MFVYQCMSKQLTQCLKVAFLFCAPLGCTHFEPVRPPIILCTPLVYVYDEKMKMSVKRQSAPLSSNTVNVIDYELSVFHFLLFPYIYFP